MISIRDRGKGVISVYETTGIGLTINWFSNGLAGFMRGWELTLAPNQYYSGKSIEELIAKLKELFPNCKIYNRNKKNEITKKDIVVIYTNCFKQLKGFLYNKISEEFSGKYFQIEEFFEFRPIDIWCDTLKTSAEIADFAQTMIDTVFIPEQYFYITTNQRLRKKLQRSAKEAQNNLAYKIFSPTYTQYLDMRKGFFGGIVFCPYPKVLIDEPMLALDITSSYIFDLLIEKHCITQFEHVEPNLWERYLYSENYSTYGCYKIKYEDYSARIGVYTDINGNKLETGEHEVSMVLNNIDLQNLINLTNIKHVECVWLKCAKIDYLPKCIRDVVVEEYIKKESLTGRARALQKPVVNGAYGNSARNYKTQQEFWDERGKATLAPQWGVWIVSYAKKNLIKLALKVNGWFYSDTDSIYCLDTPENRAALEEFNNEIRARIKMFCDKFGYDYEALKNLGTFKLEHEIKRFKAWGPKMYVYEHEDGIELKAAGLVKEKITVDESLFEIDTLKYPTVTHGFINDKHAECDVDGEHYENECSYFEIESNNTLLAIAMAKFQGII